MSDDNIPLKSVAAYFSCRPALRTLYRWIDPGLLVKDTKGVRVRVRLEVVRQGGRIYTSEEKILRFDRRNNAPRLRRRKQ